MQAISIPIPNTITPIGYIPMLGCSSNAANKQRKPEISNANACQYWAFLDDGRANLFVDMNNEFLRILFKAICHFYYTSLHREICSRIFLDARAAFLKAFGVLFTSVKLPDLLEIKKRSEFTSLATLTSCYANNQ
jgi:hypothetical protein